jgi:hypothetical protein
MKKYLFSLFVFCMFVSGMPVRAQECIPAAGGNATGSGGTASYTAGQVVYTTNTGTTGSAAQGVQQPYEISVITGLEDALGIDLNCSAYPNPASDIITLKVEDYDIGDLSYQLYDINGIMLENKKIKGNEIIILMGDLSPSVYFLKVINNQKEIHHVKSNKVGSKQFNVVKTFKIIKTQ